MHQLHANTRVNQGAQSSGVAVVDAFDDQQAAMQCIMAAAKKYTDGQSGMCTEIQGCTKAEMLLGVYAG